MKKSFTLLEILVVIIIIGIIASMTFVSLNGTRAKSRDAKRISDIRQIQSALEMYRNDNNTYPQYVTPGMALIGSINGQTYMKQIPNAPGKMTALALVTATAIPQTTLTPPTISLTASEAQCRVPDRALVKLYQGISVMWLVVVEGVHSTIPVL